MRPATAQRLRATGMAIVAGLCLSLLGAVAPAAAAPDTIQGTLRLESLGQPAAAGEVIVEWTKVGEAHLPQNEVAVDDDGDYTITGLEPGARYWLFFDYVGTAGYHDEWHGAYPYATVPPEDNQNSVAAGTPNQVITYLLRDATARGWVMVALDANTRFALAGEADVSWRMLSPEPGSTSYGDWSTPIVVGASGVFQSITKVHPGTYQVRIRYLGSEPNQQLVTYVSTTVERGLLPDHPVIPKAKTVSGVVSLGAPAIVAPEGSVRVTLEQQDESGAWAAKPAVLVDTAGAYRFEGLDTVASRLIFEYLGSGPFEASKTWGPFTPQNTTVNVTLVEHYAVSGHVDLLTAGNSAPAGAVAAELLAYPAGGTPVATATVGAGGDYAMHGVPAGSYQLVFRYLGEEDFPDWYWSTNPVGGAPTAGNITPIHLPGDAAEFDVVIGQGVGMFGTITDGNGEPVAGAEVRLSIYLMSDGTFYQSRTTTSEADGDYQFVSLYTNTFYVLDVFADGYAPQTWPGYSLYYIPGLIDLQGQQVHGVDQVLQRDASISGTVSSANPASLELGSGTATAVVWVYDYELERYVDTGDAYPVAADGTYSIPGLYPDGYQVRLAYTGPGGHPNLLSPVVDLDEDEDATQHFWLAQGGSHAQTFADIPSNHAFSREIEWMFEEGITTGYVEANGQRTYRSVEDVSRQAMAAFLYRAAGSPAFAPPSTPSFTDVPLDHPFYSQIEWMKQENITTGNLEPDGSYTYRPLEAVSRQAMAAFLYRFAGRPPFEPESSSFSDVSIDAPFGKEIEWLKQAGISNGNADGTFRPIESVSRQAMAAFVYRYGTNEPTAQRARSGFEASDSMAPDTLPGGTDRSELVLPLDDVVPVG